MQESSTITFLKYLTMAMAGGAGVDLAKHDYWSAGAFGILILALVIIVTIIQARHRAHMGAHTRKIK